MSELNISCSRPYQGYIESGIAEIEQSTKRIIAGQTRRFEAYIEILKSQIACLSEVEERNEYLQSEMASVTEKLSLRELEIESKEKRIFELEKKASNSAKDRKSHERELSRLNKEKQNLMSELSEMRSKLEAYKEESALGKNKKRGSHNLADEDPPVAVKKSRLRRLQNEEVVANSSSAHHMDSKKSISKDIGSQKDTHTLSRKQHIASTEMTESDNPLKDVLEKTNLGRIKAPLLKSRIVKAAEAANPNMFSSSHSLQLKSLNGSGSEQDTGMARPRKTNKSERDSSGVGNAKKQKSTKKTSKVSKVARIPHYSENVLNSMKVSELKDICNEIDLEVNPKSRKLEIIQAILSFQGE